MAEEPKNPELEVQSGLPIHVFTFMHGAERLQFATPGKTPEDAADALIKMLHDLVIQIRIKYPQRQVIQSNQSEIKNG